MCRICTPHYWLKRMVKSEQVHSSKLKKDFMKKESVFCTYSFCCTFFIIVNTYTYEINSTNVTVYFLFLRTNLAILSVDNKSLIHDKISRARLNSRARDWILVRESFNLAREFSDIELLAFIRIILFHVSISLTCIFDSKEDFKCMFNWCWWISLIPTVKSHSMTKISRTRFKIFPEVDNVEKYTYGYFSQTTNGIG